MPIASTAKRHFDEDIGRASALLDHAFSGSVTDQVLQDDVARSAWMIGVGAADAFFCDAYADAIARSLQAKQLEPSVTISKRLNDLKIPVAAVIRGVKTGNWGWRMAARDLIERESVLDLETVRKHFNQFFDDDKKLFGADSFDSWILHADWQHRLFGTNKTSYRALSGRPKTEARKKSKKQFEKRFHQIFQRRHDCIHNCDRVKTSLNKRHIRSKDSISKTHFDLKFLVERFVEELQAEFPEFISRQGYSGATKARVCQ